MVENLPAVQETWVSSLGGGVPLGKEMATHSSVLAWRIPWTEEPGGLQSVRSQRVGHVWTANTFTFNILPKHLWLCIFSSPLKKKNYILTNLFIWLRWGSVAACWAFLLWGIFAVVHGLSSCVADSDVACRHGYSAAYRILAPHPRISPTSPALQGGFLTARSPGKSLFFSLEDTSHIALVAHSTLPAPHLN